MLSGVGFSQRESGLLRYTGLKVWGVELDEAEDELRPSRDTQAEATVELEIDESAFLAAGIAAQALLGSGLY